MGFDLKQTQRLSFMLWSSGGVMHFLNLMECSLYLFGIEKENNCYSPEIDMGLSPFTIFKTNKN